MSVRGERGAVLVTVSAIIGVLVVVVVPLAILLGQWRLGGVGGQTVADAAAHAAATVAQPVMGCQCMNWIEDRRTGTRSCRYPSGRSAWEQYIAFYRIPQSQYMAEVLRAVRANGYSVTTNRADFDAGRANALVEARLFDPGADPPLWPCGATFSGGRKVSVTVTVRRRDATGVLGGFTVQRTATGAARTW